MVLFKDYEEREEVEAEKQQIRGKGISEAELFLCFL